MYPTLHVTPITTFWYIWIIVLLNRIVLFRKRDIRLPAVYIQNQVHIAKPGNKTATVSRPDPY